MERGGVVSGHQAGWGCVCLPTERSLSLDIVFSSQKEPCRLRSYAGVEMMID